MISGDGYLQDCEMYYAIATISRSMNKLRLYPLVTELSKLFSNSLEFRKFSGLSGFSDFVELLFIESAGFELSLLLELFNEGLLLPADGMGQITQAAVFSVILHSDNLKGIRDDFSLLVVIWWWDALESF